jgi:hypothetical protein
MGYFFIQRGSQFGRKLSASQMARNHVRVQFRVGLEMSEKFVHRIEKAQIWGAVSESDWQ